MARWSLRSAEPVGLLRARPTTFRILGVAALIRRELLEILGINLGAFGVEGGLVVALMGFEMLCGGTSSRTQGAEEAGRRIPTTRG